LAFTNDAHSLYYSTNLDGSIQHYSVDRTRLLDPVQTNPCPPTAMAISPTGHLMVSATDKPNVVHLRNLEHNSAAVIVKPQASDAAVSSIAFHPERPNIFVLAFIDGTIVAYDATRITKAATGSASGESRNKGEIGRATGLYKAVTGASAPGAQIASDVPIVGVAFIPGFKTRVVTAGVDGRCRLVDVAQGGSTIRTWHTKMPITSLDVIGSTIDQVGAGHAPPSVQERLLNPRSLAGDPLIAVSHIDGTVQIYNTVGLLWSQKIITSYDERILSVAWMRGTSPASLNNSKIEKHFSSASKDPFESSDTVTLESDQCAPEGGAQISEEIDTDTTRIHSPPTSAVPILPSLTRPNFEDLFSPIKAHSPPRVGGDLKSKGDSPKRHRPRISNQTFIYSPPPEPGKQSNIARQRNIALFPSTDSETAVVSVGVPSADLSTRLKLKPAVRQEGLPGSPLNPKKRQVAFKAATPRTQGRGFANAIAVAPNTNARVLADLRKLAGPHGSASRRNGTLSSYAVAQQKLKPSTSSHVTKVDKISVPKEQWSHDSPKQQRQVHVNDPDTWPTDSASIPSFGDEEVDDIWLTSEAEESQPNPPRRRGHRQKRISKSSNLFPEDFDSGIGYSEPTTMPHSASTYRDHAQLRFTDPPMSNDDLEHNSEHNSTHKLRSPTIATSLLDEDDMGPTSEDVRKHFPRMSSRSPRRTRRKDHAVEDGTQQRKGETARHSPPPGFRHSGAASTLMSLAIKSAEHPRKKLDHAQTAPQRQRGPQRHRDPRGQEGRLQSFDHNHDNHDLEDDDHDHDHQDASAETCPKCHNTRARVTSLEGEVVILKAEVLALKALLRRHGIPASAVAAATSKSKSSLLPACLRG
jgi:hypothetical protein